MRSFNWEQGQAPGVVGLWDGGWKFDLDAGGALGWIAERVAHVLTGIGG